MIDTLGTIGAFMVIVYTLGKTITCYKATNGDTLEVMTTLIGSLIRSILSYILVIFLIALGTS